MRAVSAGFEAALVRGHQRVARLSALNADLTDAGLDVGGLMLGGSVSIGSDRRRSVTLSLSNPDGNWTPQSAADPFYPNRIVRVERGIVVDGEPEFVSLGVFLIDRPVVTRSSAGVSLSIQGQDRLKLALRSKFTAPVRYDEGVGIGELIQTIAQDAGMGSVLYRIDDQGKSLRADRSFELGEARVDVMRAIAADYSLDLYVDADGFLVVAPTLSLDNLPTIAWRFRGGDEAIMLGLTKDWGDDRLYNHVLVTGEASDLVPVFGEARDLNPESPAYNPVDGSGPIGDRLWQYSSAMIRDAQQAQDVADAMLLDVALLEETIQLPTMVHPALEVGDVVAVVDAPTRTSDLYLLDEVSIPVAAGAMTLGSRKLRALSATGELVDFEEPPPVTVIVPPTGLLSGSAGIIGLAIVSAAGTVTPAATPPGASLPFGLPHGLP